jgi:S-adenosylmethionine:tRNA ribosyltransferase-isomerase
MGSPGAVDSLEYRSDDSPQSTPKVNLVDRSSDYDFDLPSELIAQYPSPTRGADRLLVLDRADGKLHHTEFSNLPDYLVAGDVLVLNDSRVIHARLHGNKPTGGKVEVFLVRLTENQNWLCLLRAPHGVKEGLEVRFDRGRSAHVLGKTQDGLWEVVFQGFESAESVPREIGDIPLPPYIRRHPEHADRERYQTVYAASEGSVAAPTAGLHFTPSFLNEIVSRGVQVAKITLHVGPGTFRPIRTERLEDHAVDPEAFSINDKAAGIIHAALVEGRRVVAVGTTVTRALEHVAETRETLTAEMGWTHLFIHPPFEFKVVGALLTNFHLPRSSLFVLVAAFAGNRQVLNAYHTAIQLRYRFYSYGDAMLIV